MDYSAKSDIGKVRSTNQDSVFAAAQPVGALPSLFIVADGMGGHKAGDFASGYTVRCVTAYAEETGEEEPCRILQGGMQRANRELNTMAREDYDKRGMGTTMVAAVIGGHEMYVANVGDSRLYLYRGGIMIQITEDHSYVQEMVADGQLTREEARVHPQKNVITRAVGAMDDLRVDFFHVTLEDGDGVLLCSDGLTNMVEDQRIGEILSAQGSAEEKAQKLIDEANDAGGTDNVSVVYILPFHI